MITVNGKPEELEGSVTVNEHQAALNQLFEEHKALRKQQAEEEIAAETEKLKREANKALSAEQLSIKRSLSAKNMELKKKLFAEVREKMADFKKTPEYKTWLETKIQDAVSWFCLFRIRRAPLRCRLLRWGTWCPGSAVR